MSIKLKDALFEMTNNEVHNIFENKKEIPIEDNIQTLSKATLEMVSKAIAQKINSQITNPSQIGQTKKTIARLKTSLKGKLNA